MASVVNREVNGSTEMELSGLRPFALRVHADLWLMFIDKKNSFVKDLRLKRFVTFGYFLVIVFF